MKSLNILNYNVEKHLLKYTNIELLYFKNYFIIKSNFAFFLLNKKILYKTCFINIKNDFNFYFICKLKFIKTILFNLKNIFYGLYLIYFIKLKLIGLTARGLFKVKQKKIKYNKSILKSYKYIRFEIGYNHFVDIFLANNLFFRKKKKKFIIFANSKKVLHCFVLFLKNIKKMTAYKLKGMSFSGFKLKFKKGKKSFRSFR